MSLNYENKLWEDGILGEDTPDRLRNTVLFLLRLHVALRAGDEHHNLHRDCPENPSQLSLRRNESGVICLVYQENSVTKTNDGGLKHMRKDRKIMCGYIQVKI